MDQLMNNPFVKGAIRKFLLVLLLLLALEVGCIIGVGYLVGGISYAFAIMFFISLMGYALKPSDGSWMTSTRMLVSVLLMIPGYLTTLVALVVLIGPLRRMALNLVKRKFLPADMNGMDGNLGGLGGANPFMKMGNMGASPFSGGGDNWQSTRASDDIIDVDYDVKDGTRRDEVKVEVNRSNRYSEVKPKALMGEDIVDVEHEWK